MTKETSNKKNWKGKVAKQWKRMHAGSSPAQGTTYPEGGSIGMFFHDSQQQTNEYILRFKSISKFVV